MFRLTKHCKHKANLGLMLLSANTKKKADAFNEMPRSDSDFLSERARNSSPLWKNQTWTVLRAVPPVQSQPPTALAPSKPAAPVTQRIRAPELRRPFSGRKTCLPPFFVQKQNAQPTFSVSVKQKQTSTLFNYSSLGLGDGRHMPAQS